MLGFDIPANGWDILYSALLTAASIVLAFFLGRAAERRAERRQKYARFESEANALVREHQQLVFEGKKFKKKTRDGIKKVGDFASELDRRDLLIARWTLARLAHSAVGIIKMRQSDALADWEPVLAHTDDILDTLRSWRTGGKQRRRVAAMLTLWEKNWTIEESIPGYLPAPVTPPPSDDNGTPN